MAATGNTTPPLTVGFLGAGAIAELHRRAFDDVPGIRLGGFYEPDPERRAAREKDWQVPAYPSADALVGDPRIDAVYVLSPVEHHEAQAMLVLEAGKPLFVEKPVAPTPDAIARIAAVARRRNVFCMPGHNYVYDPALAPVRDALAAGEFGRVYTVAIHYAIRHDEALAARYPGVLEQVVPHHLYTLRFLGEEPVRVAAMTTSLHYRRITQDDQVGLLVECRSGALGLLFASMAADDWSADPWTFGIKILGEKGSVGYTWRTAVVNRPRGTHPQAYLPFEATFAHEARFFLQACRGERAVPLSTLEDAVLVEATILAARRAATEGRTVAVEVPRAADIPS
ncbi:MAG: Gfo/Idh/MocA family oxidoreductase [Actinomycetia bacterium]|nr:Gfo/Idh/MocA family oxidoreductase [Actinomycetes bacterium]